MFAQESITRKETWLLFSAISAALWAFATYGPSWSAYAPALCLGHGAGCWCETHGDALGGVRQPSNAWSSLAFVFSGCLVVPVGMSDFKALKIARYFGKTGSLGILELNPTLTMLAGLSYIGVGISSWFFHASLTYVGHWMDHTGMGLISSWFTVMNLAKTGVVEGQAILLVYLAYSAAYSAMCWFFPLTSRFLFLGTMGVGIWVYMKGQTPGGAKAGKDSKHLNHCLQFFALAHVFWGIDMARVGCDPDSLLQGHSAWHLCCAVACLFGWEFFRSETKLALD